MGMAAEAQFHVLAVDDSHLDRKLIERLLKTSSYHGNFIFLFLRETERCHEKESLLLYWILIVCSFWVCFISTVTAVDSGSKALEFLGVLEDEQNQANPPSVFPNDHHQVLDLTKLLYVFFFSLWMHFIIQ
jgi:two-component response regulator (ARR-A family)